MNFQPVPDGQPIPRRDNPSRDGDLVVEMRYFRHGTRFAVAVPGVSWDTGLSHLWDALDTVHNPMQARFTLPTGQQTGWITFATLHDVSWPSCDPPGEGPSSVR